MMSSHLVLGQTFCIFHVLVSILVFASCSSQHNLVLLINDLTAFIPDFLLTSTLLLLSSVFEVSFLESLVKPVIILYISGHVL